MGENRKLLEDYWIAYGENKDISSHKASLNRFKRAVEIVGDLSLRSAPIEALQKAIDSKTKGNKQRDTVSALHTLFRFAKRSDRLRKNRPEVRSVRYIKEAEFQALLPYLTDEQKLVFQVAFATGCRLGEIFALEEENFYLGNISVKAQMNELGVIKETKTREIRTTIILPQYKKAVFEWLKIPRDERFKIRNLPWSKICRKVCAKAKLTKICVFHDLRHSFAIYLREHGASKDDIADTLGNSLAVVEKHYVGRVGTSQSLENLRRILANS
jgi:integrase